MNEPQRALTIAIDGPAGSGKSTLGKRLARELGLLYFDSGIMYRAVTCAALAHGLDVNAGSRIAALAESLQIDVRPPSRDDGRDNDLFAGGEEITWRVRSPEVDQSVSIVAANPGVRAALNTHLRKIGARGGIVMVGRDIGTVVLPGADIKIFLEASAEERARRRFLEREARGEPADYAEILESIRKRDEFDSSRETAPLRRAPDAFVLDSDGLSISEVLDRMLAIVREVRPQG